MKKAYAMNWQEGVKKHEALEKEKFGEGYETQYGNHVGMDADENLWIASPHMTLGKPKGDHNRGGKGGPQIDPFYDFVD